MQKEIHQPIDPRSQEHPTEPVLLSIIETANQLRVSRWTIYKLIHSGRLATVTIGKRRLVPTLAMHALIDRLSDEGGL